MSEKENAPSQWSLLRGGKAEQERGLLQIQTAHARERSPSSTMTLGVAYLWLEQYQRAADHFREVIETSPTAGDADYGMAGAAKWCLGKPDEAVSEWRAGLKARYARASGLSIRMPLLLFFAAVRQPGIFDRTLARKLLQDKTTDIRINNWPAPIARLVLDQIGEAEFHDHCLRSRRPGETGLNPFAGRRTEQQTSNCVWDADFYRSILALEQGQPLSDFRRSMRNLSDTSQPEWQDERNVLTARIWGEEFFLARHEGSSNP